MKRHLSHPLCHLFWLIAFAGLFGCQRASIQVVAVHPERPDVLYVAPSQGLLKSGDGGRTWKRADRGLGTFQVLSLAIHPTIPSTLYAGTYSDGVYRSVDGGQHWMAMHNGMQDYIAVVNALRFSPQDPSILYAATTMGIYKTTDQAASWRRISVGLESLFVVSLAVHPQNPLQLYAGTSGGVYRSDDAGEHWRTVNHGLIAEARVNAMSLGVNDMAFDPRNRIVIATARGLYQRLDDGAPWTAIPTDAGDRFVATITATPEGRLYAGHSKGLYVATVSSEMRWKRLAPHSIRAVAIHPHRPETIYIGTGEGLFKSDNGGATWTHLPTGHS